MPRLYNGVRLLEPPHNMDRVTSGACLANVDRLDMGALPMIAYMRRRGMQVDLSHFSALETEFAQNMDEITEKAHKVTGYYTNLGSGDQVAELLFKRLGLSQARVKWTKKGDPSQGGSGRESVEKDVLTAIKHDHEVVPLCMEYKELEKLLGTYVRPMPKLAQRTAFGVWRMFPNLGDTRVPSSRLNCSDPNLLAIPTRSKRGKRVRQGFITDPGWTLVSGDESQIEPRIAAHRSRDKNLVNVYTTGQDIYSDFATAAFRLVDKRYFDAEVHKWKYPTVDANEHRRPAKTCVLAAIYDVTNVGLLEQMPVVCGNCNKEADKHDCGSFRSYWNENNCQDLLNAFYMRYDGLLDMRKLDHRRVFKYGYIWDMWGRILQCAAVYSVLDWVVSGALREIGNFPMQSSSQGTIKLAMASLMDDLVGTKMLGNVVHPLLQIHDELLYECRDDTVAELSELNKDHFENCVTLDVPVKAGVATANSWGELEK